VNSEHVAAVAAAAVPVSALWPLLAYAAILVVLLAAVLMITHLSGERHNAAAADEPFESGIVGVGDARLRRAARFYLIAMFFVIFDVEALFVFTWAIAWREVGWAGYVEMAVFIGILLAALAYLWRLGALDWGPEPQLPQSSTP
jgi:NADH-quinone oxidoreductase subunit A